MTPKWTKYERLWPTVPWLWPSDTDEGPRCAWEVEYSHTERASCWPVPLYGDPWSETAYLMLHAIRGNGNDGGYIALSISDAPRYDVYAKEVFVTMPAQSNPRRHGYGYAEEGHD